MEVSNEKIKEYTRRLMKSRMRLLCDNGFYGLLLMHIKMNISDERETAWCDLDDRFFFNPDFLEQVSSKELEYAMMHLLLHVALKHLERKGNYDDKYFDQAADIVANSNILRAAQGNVNAISLNEYGGIQPHMVPGGDDGWKYSVEEVYRMLKTVRGTKRKESSDSSEDDEEENGCCGNGEENSGDDFYHDDNGGGSGGDDDRNSNRNDSGSGKGCNSYDASRRRDSGKGGSRGEENSLASSDKGDYKGWDYHCIKEGEDLLDDNLQDQVWQARIMQVAASMKMRNMSKEAGDIPAFIERYLEDFSKPQTDWRTVLDEFVQEEINDYSFCPPDRRFDDSPFFLPDYNEKDKKVEKVLFMIDTSGSMSDEEISMCYSEIKGAIDQFGGKLEGWLGFFDAVVVEPQPFVDEDEFKAIRPKGGGGTRFDIIFDYIEEHMEDEPPLSIVILTDGGAIFPREEASNGIPVLWIIDNEEVTPPWGKIARINVNG